MIQIQSTEYYLLCRFSFSNTHGAIDIFITMRRKILSVVMEESTRATQASYLDNNPCVKVNSAELHNLVTLGGSLTANMPKT